MGRTGFRRGGAGHAFRLWVAVEFEPGTAHQIVWPRSLSVSELTLSVERIGDDKQVHLHEGELLGETGAVSHPGS